MYENTTRKRELSNPELVRVEPLPIQAFRDEKEDLKGKHDRQGNILSSAI